MNNPYMTRPEPNEPTPACDGSYDVYDSEEPAAIKLAAAICGGCKVANCGFRRLGRTREPSTFDDCGTFGAIHRHRNRGEKFCDPCRELHNEQNRKYRARKAERGAA